MEKNWFDGMDASSRLIQGLLCKPSITNLRDAITEWTKRGAAGIGIIAGAELVDLCVEYGQIAAKDAVKVYKRGLKNLGLSPTKISDAVKRYGAAWERQAEWDAMDAALDEKRLARLFL